MVFTYLDAFCRQEQFAEYLPDYSCLEEMKEHYRKGGLGDMKCKKFLLKVMEEMLSPIREKRAKWEADIPAVYDILKAGTDRAVEKTNATLEEVRSAMRIDYFNDRAIIEDWKEWLGR